MNRLARLILPILPFLASSTSLADNLNFFRITEEQEALGKLLRLDYRLEADDLEGASVRSDVSGTVFGKTLPLIRTTLDPDHRSVELLPGESRPPASVLNAKTEVYILGKRVGNGRGRFKDGSYHYELEIPPGEKRVPVVRYALGPLIVKLDAGARYEATLRAKATPQISFPTEYSSIDAELESKVGVIAFAEGRAQALVVRAGARGEVELLDTQATANARFYFQGSRPDVHFSGYLSTLSGGFIAFVEAFNPLRFQWKRILEQPIATWGGYCHDFGASSGESRCALR